MNAEDLERMTAAAEALQPGFTKSSIEMHGALSQLESVSAALKTCPGDKNLALLLMTKMREAGESAIQWGRMARRVADFGEPVVRAAMEEK